MYSAFKKRSRDKNSFQFLKLMKNQTEQLIDVKAKLTEAPPSTEQQENTWLRGNQQKLQLVKMKEMKKMISVH